MTRREGAWLSSLILAALLATILLARPANEDALIYGRYALRWVAGEGLTFNSGSPVEGFSSPVWMGLLALVTSSGIPPHVSAPVLGLLTLAMLLGLTWRLARSFALDALGRCLAVLGVVLTYWVLSWASSGLETMLYALLLVWTAQEVGGSSAPRWGLALGLTSLCRPEAAVVLVLGPALDHFLAPARSPAATRQRRLAAWAAAGAWFAVALVRHEYFGLWGPNTSLKVYPQHFVDRSLPQALGFILSLGVVVPLAAWGAARAWRSRRGPGGTADGGGRLIATLLLALTFGFGFHFAVGGDYREGFRYLVPTAALWLVAALAALARFPWSDRRRHAAVAILVALTPLPWTVWELQRDPFATTDWATIRQRWLEPFAGTDWGVGAAHWIVAESPHGALVAYGQMGKAPYLAALERPDIRFLDTVGWVDRQVADLYRPGRKVREAWQELRAGTEWRSVLDRGRAKRTQAFVDLVLARDPDLVLVEPHLHHLGMDRLITDTRFLERYERIGAVEVAPPVAIWRHRAYPETPADGRVAPGTTAPL